MPDSPSAADWLAAWSTLGGAAITALSVGVAAYYAIQTLKQAKDSTREANRPMVAAYLERDPHPSGTSADMVVVNVGKSVAFDVAVTFDPPIEATGTKSDQESMVPLLLKRYAAPIPNLLPGIRLRSIWHFPNKDLTDEDGYYINDEPIPNRVIATISYRDAADADAKATNHYQDSFVLDVADLRCDVITTHSDDHLSLHKRSTVALESILNKLP